MLSLLSISFLTTLSVSSEPATNPASVFVGFLTEQANPACIDGKTTVWLDPHFELGFIPITASAVPLASYANRLVVVRGRQDQVPARAARPTLSRGPCFPAQLRSDWVLGREGARVRRNPREAAKTMSVEAIGLYDGLHIAVHDQRLVVSVESPVPDIVSLDLAVHYEGCMGKPGTTEKRQRLELSVGAGTRVEFPVHVQKGSGEYRAAAVSLLGSTDSTRVNVNVPLRVLLADKQPRCSKR